ncbi:MULTISPECIES: DUF397 domain-containing protein [unclassified Streptomyces]|uniref:DUF397 domain-containing protein n=1 Tax=Streptomyces TaxID=1883 RepID=UPI0029B9E62D|nr:MULTISPECIES: DUF397 domain-containing protein [unclassified Streptomyces]MDX2675612.1 DUF397 domain-containing protein [Streptomyces sp. NY05-11A]MDX3246929.1 DUF397 domain-containing protein [Streptomyces sp. ME18-1-4]
MTTSLNWQKSSFSGSGDGNNCLELALPPAAPHLHLRESDTPATVLTTTPTTVAQLLAGIRADALTSVRPARTTR